MKPRRYFSSYPAIVRDVHDPMRSGRIRVECPPIFGIGTAQWSPWALPKHASHLWSVPYEGETVWISLRQGDPNFPVWEGRYTTYAEASSPPEFRALAEGPYAADLRDAVDHQNRYDNADHKKGHDHGAGEFWNPYVHALVFPMGAGLVVNEEPGEQLTTVRDRIGQHLTFVGDPTAPLDPHDETRIGGAYNAPALDNGSTLYTTETWRAKTRLQSRHSQYLEMRVKDVDKEEELELRGANIAGDHGSHLTFSNSLFAKNFLLERFVLAHRQSYEAKIDPDNLTIDYQRTYDEHGQQIQINSNNVTPNRWIKTQNGLGDYHKIEWDLRVMEWADHNAQSIFFNTDERIPLRFIEVKNAPGESIKIEHDGQKITIKDRDGTYIEFNPLTNVWTLMHYLGDKVVLDGVTINALHKTGSQMELAAASARLTNGAGETVHASAGGVAIGTAAGATVNGRRIALNGDPCITPVGPGTVIGTGI